MRGLKSLSGGEWGKPPRVVFLGGIHQEEGRIILTETNPGVILKLGKRMGLESRDSCDTPNNIYKRK